MEMKKAKTGNEDEDVSKDIIICCKGSVKSMAKKLKEATKNKDTNANVQLTGTTTSQISDRLWSCIAKLELYQSRFESDDSVACLRKLIFSPDCCPNLQELKLSYIHVKGAQAAHTLVPLTRTNPEFEENRKLTSLSINYGCCIGISWIELLTHFPRLEKLTFTSRISITDKSLDLHCLAKCVSYLRERNSENLPLTHVDIRLSKDPNPPELLNLFINETFKLESVGLKIERQDDRALKNILRTNASTLKRLYLVGGGTLSFNPNNVFVRLENLEELVLKEGVFTSAEVLLYTPNLKELELKELPEFITRANTHEMASVSLVTCKKLSVQIPFQKTEDLEKLMKWFPNVTKLNAQLNNDTFPLVCDMLAGLVSLTVRCISPALNDVGFTGFDLVCVEKINKGRELQPFKPDGAIKRRPNITDMTNLRSLSLKEGWPNNTLEIGYCSTVYGFEQIPSLEYIYLDVNTNEDTWQNFKKRLVDSRKFDVCV